MREKIVYILLLCLWLSGCTSDFFDIRSESERSGILLTLPASDINFATRSTAVRGNSENPEEAEGEIHSISIYAYPSGTDGEFFSATLKETDKNADDKYELDIKPGSYRIYTIANMELPSDIAETDLKGRIISAESGNFNGDGTLPSSGIPMTAMPGEYQLSADGEYYGEAVEIKNGEMTPLYCNMRFALVKVRINILRNHAPSAEVGDISITGQSESEPLFPSFYQNYDYGNIASHKLGSGELNYSADPPVGPGNEWLYQAVYYLPERIVDDARQMTRLAIPIINDSGIEKEVSLTLGSDNNGEEGENVSELPISPKYLLRGHLYDYTLTDNGEWTFRVSGWTQKSLVYNLNGETYLDLERTSLDLRSSEIALIGYDTNARHLSFESPLFNNKIGIRAMEKPEKPTSDHVDLLLFSTTTKNGRNYISVRVNPLVKKWTKEMDNIQNYPFTIIADGIRKNVTINSLLGERFLRVFPEEIELDIESLRADSIDQVSVPITWESNLLNNNNNYNCEITKYSNWNRDDMTLSTPLPGNSPSIASGTNTLTLKNILTSSNWNTGKTIILKYSSSFNNSKAVNEVKVKITPPKNSSYTIWFKHDLLWAKTLININSSLMVEPHIFVYQELTLPESMEDFARKGKRVAISNSTPNIAAYKYVFSGKIAFKGWMGYDGGAPEANNPDASGRLRNNLFVFDEYSFDISSKTNERYDFNHEFNEALRKSSTCPKCKITSADQSFLEPGIRMITANDGWHKYELTGIADPKNTYIRFYAHHDYDICYPSKDEPALRLFDFKDREGWLDLSANMTYFSDDRPDKSINLGINPKSPIYWDTNSKWKYIKIIDYNNIFSLEKNRIYPPTGLIKDDVYMYYYFDFAASNLAEFSITFQLVSDLTENASKSKQTTFTQKTTNYIVTE